MATSTVRATTTEAARLLGRRVECERLDRLVESARHGASGALVVRGEPGRGKSALLDYVVSRASGCLVVRAAGVESEMELAFAGLHQLCAPFLDRIDRMPPPQRAALATAFGLQTGDVPDRFLVGLAVLNLLAEVAETQPLVCLVDDSHWLDQASAQVLGFVARRLGAEAIVVIFAIRDPWEDRYLRSLPELVLPPLNDMDAQALLASAIHGKLDELVRDRMVAEAHGNPLALLELPRAWTPAALAGGFGVPDGTSVAGWIEESFRRRLAPLSDDTRRLLLIAAADPVGDPGLILAAADQLSIPLESATTAAAAGLLDDGSTLRFRHPLVRSVVYRDASVRDRRVVHAALAAVSDPAIDPDRRAWHLAAAAGGPDEAVAVELERSAARAQARGGVGAAAAFRRRALALTEDPSGRAERALSAGQASYQAGAFDAALEVLSIAEDLQLDGYQQARVDLLRGQVAFASGSCTDAPRQLLDAARRLEPFDVPLARETYMTAWRAAFLAERGDMAAEISRAVRALGPAGDTPRPIDLLLDGVALRSTEGPAAAVPVLKQAAKALDRSPAEDVLRWGWVAALAHSLLWDIEALLDARHIQLVRDVGALAELPIHLLGLAVPTAWIGDFAGASALIAEAESVAAATGSRVGPYASLRLAALRGREVEVSALRAAAVEEAALRGEGLALISADCASAVLYNGLGRYEEAAVAAHRAISEADLGAAPMWSLPELVEAAVRNSEIPLAHSALERLASTTAPCGTDVPLGIEARCRALLCDGATAERLYGEAIDRLGRTRLRPELARAHLLYGEWLRREGRRIDAREQLHTAYDAFDAIGMEAFGERARRELLATGETVRKRSVETQDQLTPQELQIARLASHGRTNPEIGAQLFLSPRTVEWHLRKVFGKLEIESRKELPTALKRPDGYKMRAATFSPPRPRQPGGRRT